MTNAHYTIIVPSRHQATPNPSGFGWELGRMVTVALLVGLTIALGLVLGRARSAQADSSAITPERLVARESKVAAPEPKPVESAESGSRMRPVSTSTRSAHVLDEQLSRAIFTPSLMPTQGRLSSRFGYRNDPVVGGRRFHRGLDISAPPGEPVVATADGLVTRAGRRGGLGRSVSITHGNGLVTRYSHLASIGVTEGEAVRQGEVIGSVGISGRATGYHLHYEVFDDGRPVDPMGYISPRTRS